MKSMLLLMLSLLAPALVHAGEPTKPTAAQELATFKKTIRAKYDMMEKAFADHDAETIVTKFYAADAVSIVTSEGIFSGIKHLRPVFHEVISRDGRIKIESQRTYVKGDAGWDWADYHVQPGSPQVKPYTMAVVFLWAKENGEWICKGDFSTLGSIKDGKLVRGKP